MEEAERQTRYVIVTAGPVGSGKSDVVHKVKALLGIEEEPHIDINVDKLVEKSKTYKAEVKKILQNIKDCKRPNDSCQSLDNPSSQIRRQFERAYFSARYNSTCSPLSDRKSCETQSWDPILYEAVVNNKSHVVIETNGKSYSSLTWFLTGNLYKKNNEKSRRYLKSLKDNYRVVYAVPAVKIDSREEGKYNILDRIKKRASTATKRFLNCSNQQYCLAPRLPDVSVLTLKNHVQKLKQSLNELYAMIRQDNMPQNIPCRLLVFDNYNYPRGHMKLVFDSSPDFLNNILCGLYDSSTISLKKINKK